MRAILPAGLMLGLFLMSPDGRADVNVSGTFNGATIPTPCNASDIRYTFATGKFTFTCNGLTYTCSAPAAGGNWVTLSYSTDPKTLALTCINGTAVGLQVDIADLDGQRAYCVAASNVIYNPPMRRFSYTCGLTTTVCYPTTLINFDISEKSITVSQCSTTNPQFFFDSFE